MDRRVRRRALTVALAVTLLPIVAGSAAASSTSFVIDPAGDAVHAPGFMDVVRAAVTKTGRTYEFRTTLAEPIPANPQLPASCRLISWAWGIDTDLTTFPSGYPVAPGIRLQAEFVLRVDWDGTAFSGVLIDRRPLLVGEEALIAPRSFSNTSSDVQMVVDASVLGSPTSFLWDSTPICWSGPVGSFGNHFTDATDPFFNPSPS